MGSKKKENPGKPLARGKGKEVWMGGTKSGGGLKFLYGTGGVKN